MHDRLTAPRLLAAAFAASICAGMVGHAPDAYAVSVTPTQLELTTTGARARGLITVKNDSPSPMPVEASLVKFSLDDDGTRRDQPAGDEFLVFPPQALIPPGATQVFRLQWLGDPLLAESESYMLSISQIPVKIPKSKSGVQVALGFGVVINVSPPRAVPQLELVDVGIVHDHQGRRFPSIVVYNPSNAHALLPHSTIRLASGSWTQTIPSGLLAQKLGVGLVQPGRRRKFVLPVALPPGIDTVRASLEFEPKQR